MNKNAVWLSVAGFLVAGHALAEDGIGITRSVRATAEGPAWTRERMARAIPMSKKADLKLRSDVTPMGAGSANLDFTSSQLIPLTADRQRPYRAAGKLFFSDGIYDYVCSGAVIRKRVVLTAGHCLSDGVGGFYTDWLFVPAYRDGVAPYGAWVWKAASTTALWHSGGGGVPNEGDFGLLSVNDNASAQSIRTVAGFFNVLYTTATTGHLADTHVTMLGYPVGFDGGEKMHQVNSSDHATQSNDTYVYGSDMTGGSSGGPWIENFGKYSVGQSNPPVYGTPNMIVGVTSYGPIDTTVKYQGSSDLDNTFKGLLDYHCNTLAVGDC